MKLGVIVPCLTGDVSQILRERVAWASCCGTGCPVIARDRCTNRPGLRVDRLVFPHGDVGALAELMRRADGQAAGRRVVADVVKEYDCRAWVGRVLAMVAEVTE